MLEYAEFYNNPVDEFDTETSLVHTVLCELYDYFYDTEVLVEILESDHETEECTEIGISIDGIEEILIINSEGVETEFSDYESTIEEFVKAATKDANFVPNLLRELSQYE